VVTPGDKLVFVLSYRNGGGSRRRASRSPIRFPNLSPSPAATMGAVVSVDGGKSWGALAALKVVATRTAPAARRRGRRHPHPLEFGRPIAAGNGGKLSFRGIVK
jgi:hypothetical protein